jgi:hypothetical protein
MNYKEFVKLKNKDVAVRVTGISRDTFVEDPELAYSDEEFEDAKFYVEKVGILENVQDIRHMGYGWGFVRFDNGMKILVGNNDVEVTQSPTTGADYLPEIDDTEDTGDNGYRELTPDEKEFADKIMVALVASGASEESSRVEMIKFAVGFALERTEQMCNKWKLLED